MLQHVIANEDDGVKAFLDHTDFRGSIPAVVTARGRVRSVKAVTPAFGHGFQQSLAVVAEQGMLRTIMLGEFRGCIKLGRGDTAVLMSFKMDQVARRHECQW